jgi:hypothetical protein
MGDVNVGNALLPTALGSIFSLDESITTCRKTLLNQYPFVFAPPSSTSMKDCGPALHLGQDHDNYP